MAYDKPPGRATARLASRSGIHWNRTFSSILIPLARPALEFSSRTDEMPRDSQGQGRVGPFHRKGPYTMYRRSDNTVEYVADEV